MDYVFALADCANFFVNCERVFDPALRDRPVAVLSETDGTIIARSDELKAEGIPIGEPFFEWEEQLQATEAEILRSNYALYGDVSRRVYSILEAESLELKRYSIDQVFLVLPSLKKENLQRLANGVRRRILQQVGVPIYIGMGPTKTLAKVAVLNAKARKRAGIGNGVYVCPTGEERLELLRRVPVGDIWGISSADERKLHKNGVFTGGGFRALPDPWIISEVSAVGLRVASELRGRSCLNLQMVRPGRALVQSKSLGTRVQSREAVRRALAKHSHHAAGLLRENDLMARGINVFITTTRHGKPPYYAQSATAYLPEHTAEASDLARASQHILGVIFRGGFGYKKTGISLYDICCPKRSNQEGLSNREGEEKSRLTPIQAKTEQGRGPAGRSTARRPDAIDRAIKRNSQSPRYTTRWRELPVARA